MTSPVPAGGIAERLGRALNDSPHLSAIRDGVVAALPVILVSSALLLLAAPPLPALAIWLAPWAAPLGRAVRALNGGLAVYVAFGCAHSLALRRGIDPLGPAVGAAAALILSAADLDGTLAGAPIERLNQSGLFAGLALGLAAAELAHWAQRRDLVISLPAGVPPAIARSFVSLVPSAGLLAAVLTLRLLGLDLIGVTAWLARPLLGLADSYAGVLLVCLCDAGLYFLGVHPAALLSAFQPLWLSMLADNQAARLAGTPLPHIATREFYLWFVWQGGSGGTLALLLCLGQARASSLRMVGRLAFLPSLFNINEPLLFGVPVVLNPLLALPFLAAPLAAASLAYAAFAWQLVPRTAFEVLWTLPAPLGALLACGDWRALVLQLACLSLSTALWWPFVRRMDLERLRGETPH